MEIVDPIDIAFNADTIDFKKNLRGNQNLPGAEKLCAISDLTRTRCCGETSRSRDGVFAPNAFALIRIGFRFSGTVRPSSADDGSPDPTDRLQPVIERLDLRPRPDIFDRDRAIFRIDHRFNCPPCPDLGRCTVVVISVKLAPKSLAVIIAVLTMTSAQAGACGIMEGRASLGRSLFLAFVAIAGFPVLTALWGWFQLGDVERNQDILINDTLPAIMDVRGFTDESSKIVAAAPEFAAVTREDERMKRAPYLLGLVDALHQRLERNRNHNNLPPYALSMTVMDMRDSIGVLDVLVQRRIRALDRQRDLLADGREATVDIAKIADTLVASSEVSASTGVRNLYDLARDPTRTQGDLQALDALVEGDLLRLGQIFDLRAQATEIGTILGGMAEADTGGELDAAHRDLETHLGLIRTRIAAIPDPLLADRATTLLGKITPREARAEDLYSVSQRLQGINARIVTVEDAVQRAAAQMDKEADALAQSFHASAAASGARASDTIRFARQLTTLGAIAALMVSLGVLIFYVRGNILRRLERLSSTMVRLADGDTREPVIPSGHDEIASMETAVEVFRQQAVENRRLEEERSRYLDELYQHRNELERLVLAQTEQLRGEVAAHHEARLRAENADRAKSEFLAMMSHELRTPMNGVLGMLRSLGRDHLTPRQRSYLRAAEVSGTGLMALLNDILYLPLVESGRLVETVSVFSMHELVQDITYLMSPVAHEKGLSLQLVLPDDLPPALQGDVAKLRQIVFNLVANALKFTESGTVTLRIEAEAERAGKIPFVISVTDTGKGISEWALERIFEIFEQENSATRRQYGGTGLGLAICRRFAAAMGGGLSVESALGSGSVFTLRVSFRPGDPADLPKPDSEPHAPLKPLSVLVVEDHAINRMVVETYLEAGGHHWQIAESGEAAIAILGREDFDVVLMDLNLPGMSGTEATRKIRRLRGAMNAVPVIGISAHVQQDQIMENLAAGMAAVLPKPLTSQQLHAALTDISAPDDPAPAEEMLDAMLADFGPARTVQIGWAFLDRMADDLDLIEKAAAMPSREALVQAAHKLKGAAGNLALTELVDCLHDLETAARAGDGAAVDRHLARLRQIAPGLRQRLGAALRRLDAPIQAEP